MLLKHLQEVTAVQQGYQTAADTSRGATTIPECSVKYLLSSRSLPALHESQELGA